MVNGDEFFGLDYRCEKVVVSLLRDRSRYYGEYLRQWADGCMRKLLGKVGCQL